MMVFNVPMAFALQLQRLVCIWLSIKFNSIRHKTDKLVSTYCRSGGIFCND